jgi:hypothetical protein
MPGNGVPGESMVKFGPLAGRRYPGQAKLPHRRQFARSAREARLNPQASHWATMVKLTPICLSQEG